MTLYLHVLDSSAPRQVFRLDDLSTLRIGRRHDCDIPLQERSVSRRHCLFAVREGRVRVEDTYSRNGTWIDARRLSVPTEIEPGAVLRLAGARVELRDEPGVLESAHQVCTSPGRLSQFLPGRGAGRKLRLLACAWLRHLGGFHPEFNRLLDRTEQFADGKVDLDEVSEARRLATPGLKDFWLGAGYAESLLRLADPSARSAVQGALDVIRPLLEESETAAEYLSRTRDILGDFFHPLRPAPEWLCWDDQAVTRVARAIYERGSFEDMPILADALEEAGCDDASVLEHCRGDEPHVKGCWVLDGLLGTPQSRPGDSQSCATLPPE
jgi:hypothetical protein